MVNMDPTELDTIARWTGGHLAGGDPALPIDSICTDSRALKAADLFLALRGENFDGHKFIAEAARRGAVGAVVEDAPEGLPPGFAVIRVGNTLGAFQQISANYRRLLSLQVIAVTGSNGKTSTKDFTAAVLGEHFHVVKTEGNFNNHIGLPLTMLRARSSDQIGVFEIGMSHPGEIAPLAALAAPDVAIITNIGVAHIEYMRSREAIALEKGALAEALPPCGLVILNAEDDFSKSIAARTKADAIFCGLDRGDVRATHLRQDFTGMKFRLCADDRWVDAELPVPGVHMVRNALLAVAAGRYFGLSLEECAEGLRKLRLTHGRLEQKIIGGIHVLDDTYNANPDSMSAALQTLAQMPAAGRRIAVLGRMAELGAESEPGHRRVGRAAAELGIDCIIDVGAEPAFIAEEAGRGGVAKVLRAATVEDAVQVLRELAQPGDIVLVKGSRSSRLERIVEGMQTP
jgi:UDP-N-acetylmuramoyl-tripeptide--D-alanyl-D-alanine ligase